MKALVTGGAGFIGSHIVDRLLADGHEVTVLNDFSTRHKCNLAENARLEVVEGDVRDFDSVSRCMSNADWVFHKAAVASVPKTVNDPVGSSRARVISQRLMPMSVGSTLLGSCFRITLGQALRASIEKSKPEYEVRTTFSMHKKLRALCASVVNKAKQERQ